ncbi:hypothetical protein [Actinomadura sp. WMMA1423]|uniref:hypothetical protein n=1 Tax=Actinomadura sp. WMMA1423 TaxID=2591108 RepID=UPI001146DD5E|nr:hypothetical protein [Actinomadura sp. WMMA1423]
MSFSPDLSRRLSGGGFILAGVTLVAIGYGFTTGRNALEVGAPLQAVGSIAFCVITLLTKRNPFRRYPRVMWLWISLLAVGNAAVACLYPFAVDRLTLGTVAAVVQIGYYSVGLREIWRLRATSWGFQNLTGRLLLVGGVVMLNRPSPGELVGMLGALLCALGVWNTLTMLGQMRKHALEDQGAAVANLLATLLLFPVVFAVRGRGWMSWDLLSVAAPAGLLTLAVPILLTNAALRRTSKSDVGIAQSFSAPINALVALAGSTLGLLDSDQRLHLFPGWAAIALITFVAIRMSLLRKPADGEVRARAQSSGA